MPAVAGSTATNELVEVMLDRPFTTNGAVLGYEVNGVPTRLHVTTGAPAGAVLTGRALVSPEEAEDLERRQAEYRQYEASLNQNHGREAEKYL